MYYFIDNLKHYLESEEIQTERNKRNGVYLGRKYNFTIEKYIVPYNTGSAGYLLDSVAVSKLVTNIDLLHCNPAHEASSEDIYVAICLRNIVDPLYPYDTRDEFGLHRFHSFTPGFLIELEQDLSENLHEDNPELQMFMVRDREMKMGFEYFSKESVSFHYVTPSLMHLIHDFLYHCPRERIQDYFTLFGSDYFIRSNFQVLLKN
mmetsp:Transcript_32181/g.43954  ORF Transcript_32181/g.43954 Transcript_32181/m.43954 type:complete len:205 (-) Transcript_32181:36-650(-)